MANDGYILKKHPAPRILYNYLWDLTKSIKDIKLRSKSQHFLGHLYASTSTKHLKKNETAEFIPIGSRIIESEFTREFKVQRLVKMGLIEFKNHCHSIPGVKNRCREFKLTDEVFNEANKIEADAIFLMWENMIQTGKYSGMVNLMNGRTIVTRKKNELKKEKGKYNPNIPSFIIDSMKAIQSCPFNPVEVLYLVKAKRDKYTAAVEQLKEIKSEHGSSSEEYEQAKTLKNRVFGKYINDLTALKTIMLQEPTPFQHRFFEYNAAYAHQTSGRIHEINGGFLSASKPFKALFLQDLPCPIYNYDMKNAQAEILLQEFKHSGLPCPWLENYLKDPNSKQRYADKVGIPVKIWKKIFFSIVMGGDAYSPEGTVYSALLEHCKGDDGQTEKILEKVKYHLDELLRATSEWRIYLYKGNDKRYMYKHNSLHWKNACGKRLNDFGVITVKGKPKMVDRDDNLLDEESEIKLPEIKRKIAAFILQGQEACFIHHLIILCKKQNIPVYRYEYDGLMTGAPIPLPLVKKAAKQANMVTPKLELKDICSDHKLKKTLKSLNLIGHKYKE